MRYFLFLFVFLSTIFNTFGQLCPPRSGKFGESKIFNITAGYGITKVFGDVNANNSFGSAGVLKFDYLLKKGIYLGAEGQLGNLITQVRNSSNPIQSQNDYSALGLSLSIHPFELLERKSYRYSQSTSILNSLYVGLGAMYVFNDYSFIYRNINDPVTFGPIEDIMQSGEIVFQNKTKTFVLPSLNVGSALPVNTIFKNLDSPLSVVANFQLNLGRNDYLDGYEPHRLDGQAIPSRDDVYNFLYLGLRYSF